MEDNYNMSFPQIETNRLLLKEMPRCALRGKTEKYTCEAKFGRTKLRDVLNKKCEAQCFYQIL